MYCETGNWQIYLLLAILKDQSFADRPRRLSHTWKPKRWSNQKPTGLPGLCEPGSAQLTSVNVFRQAQWLMESWHHSVHALIWPLSVSSQPNNNHVQQDYQGQISDPIDWHQLECKNLITLSNPFEAHGTSVAQRNYLLQLVQRHAGCASRSQCDHGPDEKVGIDIQCIQQWELCC